MNHLYGLLGEKLAHSYSPKIHSYIWEELHCGGYYHLFEVKPAYLGDAVRGLCALGVAGINVTIPYKVNIIRYLDELSPMVQKIGAVNTLCFHEGRITGHNTDYDGFGIMMRGSGLDLSQSKVVVLGSGGAAKTVVHYLLDHGCLNVTVVARDPQKETPFLRMGISVIGYDVLALMESGDLIINTTPCGMFPDLVMPPVDSVTLQKFRVAMDLIYNPEETLFLGAARELGLVTMNGIVMLVGQAVIAQKLWNRDLIHIDSEELTHHLVKRFLSKHT